MKSPRRLTTSAEALVSMPTRRVAVVRVNALRALMAAIPEQERDARWSQRYGDIPRIVAGAGKFREAGPADADGTSEQSEPPTH